MNWIKCEIITDDLDQTMDALASIGVYEYEIVENYETLKRQLDQMQDQWDFVDQKKLTNRQEKLIVYLADQPESQARLLEIKGRIGQLPTKTELRLHHLCDSEWIDDWKRHFTQMDIGENMAVVPLWQQEVPPGKVVLRMDPGMIFGTGAHQTTQLCMRELEGRVRPGDEVLDLGCGSGILSMLCLKLGAHSALGVDIDPGAKPIAMQNCRDNQIAPGALQVLIGDLLQDQALITRVKQQQYDIVVANIVADVIIGILPLVRKCARDVFICSGIISSRISDVERALEEHGFALDKIQMEGEWAVMTTHKG